MTRPWRCGRLAAWCAALLLQLGGCAAPDVLVLHAVGHEDPQRPGSFGPATADQVRAGLGIQRQGQPQAAVVGMALAPGDRLQTGPGIAAVVRFPEGHQATLLPGTEVRLGSLLDLVGKVIVETFRKAQDRFRVSTRFVTAGVEGTRFAVQADRDDQVVVGVSEGRIELSSNGQRWPPVKVSADQMVTVRRDAPPGAPQRLRAEVDAVFDLMLRGGLRTVLPPAPPPPQLPPPSAIPVLPKGR